MIELELPNRGRLQLAHLILDVNGTIALDGAVIDGVPARLEALGRSLAVHLLTADTHGRQSEIDAQLGLKATILTHGPPEAPRKAEFVRRLGAASVIAIGNGANDVEMLKEAALGIAVFGPEGLSVDALAAADIAAASITDALDLLLHLRRLVATLRR